MLIVDANVLLDIVSNDANWAGWSARQLRHQSQVHKLVINAVVYTELSMAFADLDDIDRVVDEMRLNFAEIPKTALFLAGKAFLRYRRAGGTRTSVLPDFFIGAHAAIAGCAILTRDERRYRAYYPRVPLITPTLQ